MNALEFLISLRPSVPMGSVGTKPVEASSSQIRRWLSDKAVVINGERPGPKEEVLFPITSVVFFPKSPDRKTTVW